MRICADLGGSFIDVAILAADGTIVQRVKHPTPATDWPAFLRIFADLLARNGAALDTDYPISIATAGLIDLDSGVVTSANIACIHGHALAPEMASALGRPVTVINDADAFVLAEAGLGTGRGHKRVFGIILGTGVGGGMVEDGRIVTGPGGVQGEWGHGPVVTRSPRVPDATPFFPCGCGRSGCLDTVGGARGLERLHRFLHGVDAGSHVITQNWQAGDPAATATVQLYCDIVGGALAMLLNTFPATIVPVSGGLSSSAALIGELDRHVRVGMLYPPAGAILVPSALGGEAGLLGAFLAGQDSRAARGGVSHP